MTAREATDDDLGIVSDICAEGFTDDPVMLWVFGGDRDACAAGLRIGFHGLARSFLDDHSVLQVVDDACVTMWRAPTYVAPPPDDGRDGRESPYPAEVGERFRILGQLIEAAHPREPHWYLNVIATLPSRQGQGLGARALVPVLARCDAERAVAYLESSNPRNMTLYRRHGFEDRGDTIDLPDGPSLWPMWRAPR